MKSIIPNGLTALNLVFGMFAIIQTFQGNYYWAAVLIFAAMIADGSDGRAARYFKVSSEFGKELDSLCDLVSFGVAPAFLAYVYSLHEFGFLGQMIAVFFATCGALRLARFNVNTTTVKGYFMGLPIPAAGCVVATFVMTGIKPSGYWFLIFVAIFGYLMVSTIRYPDFKGKGEKIRPVPVVLALGVGGYLLFALPDAYLFAPFFTYAIFGIVNSIFRIFDYKSALS